MADIFISYAKEDRSRVAPLAKSLESMGWSVWWDPKIPVGTTWRQVIDDALRAARCVLVVWSNVSIDSRWVIEEADYGLEKNIYVPVLIEETKPPIGFRQLQAANLINWQGDTEHAQYRELLRALENVIGVAPQSGQASQADVDDNNISGRGGQGTTKAERKVVYAPRGGYELVRIPEGVFMMGSPKSEKGRKGDEGPQRQVRVETFYMGRFPVTNEEYGRFLAENPDTAEPDYWSDRKFNQPRQPVVGVSWDDAQAYAQWAGLHLPSEAQWEYACRAGTTTRYYSGDQKSDLDRVGWYDENSDRKLHSVGEKEPNAFGLYDMHGNVYEWVEDDSHKNYEGAPEDGSARVDEPRSADRVIRGGGWIGTARSCRSAFRVRFEPGDRYDLLGFRLVLFPGQQG